MQAENSYLSLTFISAITITLLGCMLLGLQIIRDKRLQKLRMARLILALSYLILSVPAWVEYLFRTESSTQIIATFTLATAAFQSLLFTATLLTFILPNYLTRRWMLRQLGAVVVAVALFLSVALGSRNPYPVLYAGLVIYICQLVYYTILFRRKYAESLRILEAYYDEDKRARLRWVKSGFYAALAIGVTASISAYLPAVLYNGFTIAYTVFYAWFVVRFYNYVANAAFYLSAVNQAEEQPLKDVSATDPALQEKEQKLQQALAGWVAAKGYVKSDIGIEQIARELGTDIGFLRYYFRSYMPSDFRVWRNELRIREAQRIIQEEPELSISQVGERVGISDRSNFRIQFVKITGISPAEYKRTNGVY